MFDNVSLGVGGDVKAIAVKAINKEVG